MALGATGPERGGGLLVAMVLAVLVGCRQEPMPPWQASLEGDGWVRVDRTLTDFTNHTWYGLESEHGDFRAWTYYLTPSGETGLLRGPDGRVHVDYRRPGTDGLICSRIPTLRSEELCNNALWLRDSTYMFVSTTGEVQHVWRWVEGNVEGIEAS